MPTPPRTLVVTGMHRSGTSVLAHALIAAGVAMGERMNPPAPGNRDGHFEDLEFLRFHENFLRARAIDALAPPAAWTPDPTPAEVAAADRLVAARAGKPLWGFKDPRTSLFLDFWRERLPDPRFVLLYRHPVEVVLSLLRRGSDPEVLRSPRSGFDAWRVYNRRLLTFRAAHPGECLLFEARAAAAGLPTALELIAERCAVPLAVGAAAALYDAAILRSGRELPDERWRELVPRELELHDELSASADLAAPAEAVAPSADGALAERLLWSQLANAERADATDPALVPGARRAAHVWRAAEHVARLEAQAARWQAVEQTRGWRLLTRYWDLRRAVRERLAPTPAEPPASPRGPLADPSRVLVGCVLDESPRRHAHVLRLLQSLRWFGGRLATARACVWTAAELPSRVGQRLRELGAEVRVPPPGVGSLRLRALRDAAGRAGETLLLLPRDTVVVRDPAPFLPRDAVRACLLERRLRRPGLERRAFHAAGGDAAVATPVPLDAAGALALPMASTAALADEWERCREVLLAESAGLLRAPWLVGPAALALAAARLGITVDPAPRAFDFPLAHGARLSRGAAAEADPALLRAGEHEHPDGSLAATPHRGAQARIETFNERWWASLSDSTASAFHVP